jgi:phage portal protein BeeE
VTAHGLGRLFAARLADTWGGSEHTGPDHGPGWSFRPWDELVAGLATAPHVDRDTAAGLPGIGRGASILASVVSSLTPQSVRHEHDLEVPTEVAPAPSILLEPDPEWHGPSTWRYAAVQDMIFDGNALADREADVDRLGYPRRLPLIRPSRVSWEVRGNRRVYVVDTGGTGDGHSPWWSHTHPLLPDRDQATGQPRREVLFEPSRMFHAAVDVRSGERMGRGIIDIYQQTLRLIAAVERATLVVMRAGRPVGILSVDEDLTEDELLQVKSGFMGGVRADGVAALVKARFDSVSWNASELGLIDARNHNLRLAADVLGIPPYLLGVPAESRVYSNNESEWTNLVRISAVKYLLPLADALTRCVPRGQTVRWPVDELQRPDALTRWRIHEIATRVGATSVAEIRQEEGRGPLPPAAGASGEEGPV